MGCDFSTEAKEHFFHLVSKINSTSAEITKKQETLESSLKDYKEITNLSYSNHQITKDLKSSLKKLEKVLSHIQQLQQNKSSDTVTTTNPKKHSEKFLTPEKVSLKKPKNSERNSEASKTELNPKTSEQTILKDPEIMALISKNRQLLLRQLTK